MARREYQAGKPTTLSADFNIGATSFSITGYDNWPDGAEGYNFWVTVDPGTAQEERILCSSRTNGVVTVATGGRGADGTTESNHTAGATIWPSWSATDADEANAHINATSGVHGLSNGVAVVGTTTTQTLTNKTLTSPKINENVELTATASELNILDGATLSTTELNYVDGVTSSIQTQFYSVQSSLDNITNVLIPAAVPAGTVTATARSSAPSGWLLCDGQEVSRSTYATLFSAISTTYGAGNGTTTFNVPNLKGRVPVGRDASQTEFDTLNESGGEKAVTLTVPQLPSHNHDLSPGQIVGTGFTGGSTGNAYSPLGTNPQSGTSITSTGQNQAHNNLQPYLVLNYIIKT